MMMTSNTLNNIVVFAVGAALGSAVTWKFVKTKYERIAQEEIDSVKEAFKETFKDPFKEPDENKEEEQTIDTEEYVDKIREFGYSYEKKEKEDDDMERPYVIPPSEYDEIGYETVSLEYYEDGVLVDDRDNVIRNVDELIGIDPEEHFGEYEDDSVFVRDDVAKIDYEILRHEGSYSER